MSSSENDAKEKILEDAIKTALHLKRIADIQKGIIIAFIGVVAFFLFREV